MNQLTNYLALVSLFVLGYIAGATRELDKQIEHTDEMIRQVEYMKVIIDRLRIENEMLDDCSGPMPLGGRPAVPDIFDHTPVVL